MGIAHAFRVLHSNVRAHAMRGTGVTHKLAQLVTKEPPRSKHWPVIEHRWKKAHPNCAACGGQKNVQVHHKQSFKLDPALELHDGTELPPATPPPDGKPNFISICMSELECHLKLGHGGSFAHGGYNPNVEADCAAVARIVSTVSDKRDQLSQIQQVWERAKAARVTE